MKRLLVITGQRNAKNLNVVNTIQNGDFPDKNDVSQTIKVSQEDYLDKISVSGTPSLLPQNVRWTSSDRRSLLIEEAPSYKTLVFRPGAKLDLKRAIKTYTLPMPWLYYGISPDKNKQPYLSHLWCSYKPLGDQDSYLYFLPLPNIFKSGAICTHTLADEPVELPYHLLVNQAITAFWDSIFNLDVNHYSATSMYKYLHVMATKIGSADPFDYWAKYTPDTFTGIEHKYWSPSVTVESFPSKLLAFNDFYSLSSDQAGVLMSELLVSAMELNIA